MYVRIGVEVTMERRTPTVLLVAEEGLTRERYRAALAATQYDVVATSVPDEVVAMAKRASVAAVAGGVGTRSHRRVLRTLSTRAPDCALVSLGSDAPEELTDATLDAPVRPDEFVAAVERLATRAVYLERLDAFVAAARRTTTTDRGRLRRLRDETRQLQRSFDASDFEAAFRLLDAGC